MLRFQNITQSFVCAVAVKALLDYEAAYLHIFICFSGLPKIQMSLEFRKTNNFRFLKELLKLHWEIKQLAVKNCYELLESEWEIRFNE